MSKALQAITGTGRKDAREESKTEKYDSGTPAANKKLAEQILHVLPIIFHEVKPEYPFL